MTADPGFIDHWKFSEGLLKDSHWLAYYLSLSRPRWFSHLLSPCVLGRDILQAGPPENFT